MAFLRARAKFLAGISLGVVIAATVPQGAAAGSGQMVTAGLTSQPIGHHEFCRRNPAECAIRVNDRGPEPMTGQLRTLIAAVNVKVNQSIKPMNDVDIYGKDEVWTYPGNGVGDCEDYVLLKRKMLNEKGIALSNLLITVVRKPDGEGHAVLTVRTDKGDFILDNLHNAVRSWEQTGYKFLKRQANTHTGRWVAIRDEQTTLVGSVE